MTLVLILAQATTFPGAVVGTALVRLLGSFGAAVAVVTITRGLVRSVTRSAARQRRVIDQYKSFHTHSQSKFQNQLDELFDRHDESQQKFQVCLSLMSDTQNTILRDVIVTMRHLEDHNGGFTATIEDVETNIGSLRATVQEIDSMLCNSADLEQLTVSL
jgi:flagellar hook-basal body complex protein FliE